MKRFLLLSCIIIGLTLFSYKQSGAILRGVRCSCQFFDFVVVLHAYEWYTANDNCAYPTAGLALHDIYYPWGAHSTEYVDSRIAANICVQCGCSRQVPVDPLNITI